MVVLWFLMATTITTSRCKLRAMKWLWKQDSSSTIQLPTWSFWWEGSLGKSRSTLTDSRSIYKDKPIEQRQIELALGQFTENIKKLATNSTVGYLATLDLFDKQYIHIDESVKPVETSDLDKKYQALIDKINTLDTDSYGLPKKDLLVRLQEAKLAKDEAGFSSRWIHNFKPCKTFNDRTGVTTVEYIKYLYEHVNDGRLSDELRNKVAQLTWTLYQSQSFLQRQQNWNKLFPSIYQAKQEVEEALKAQPTTAKSSQTVLDTEKLIIKLPRQLFMASWKNCTETLCLKSMSIMSARKK